jgi:membrane fusion protein, heavy metal efflux system
LVGININKLSELNISRSIPIYSPIDGYVTKVNVNIGKYVSPTEVMFELVNPTDIHLAIKVYEKDLSNLFIGQKLISFTNNKPSKKYDCEIILIGKDLSENGSTEVHCHFETYDKVLIPGTYMNAEIKLKNKNVTVLPSDAIVRFEGKHFVFKKTTNNRFEMMEISIGDEENGFTELILPTQTDFSKEEFVVKGAYSLLMAMKNKAE